jgi:hypothetical protein
MGPRARPVGVWIAVAYLLALSVVAVVVTLGTPSWGRVVLLAVILLPAIGLLLILSRWTILPLGALAMLQVSDYTAYLMFDTSRAISRPLSDVAVYAIHYNITPLVYLAGTLAVLLYTAWPWRAGILR